MINHDSQKEEQLIANINTNFKCDESLQHNSMQYPYTNFGKKRIK